MPISREHFPDEGLIITRAEGIVTDDMFLWNLRELLLTDMKTQAYRFILADWSAVEQMELSANAIRAGANIVEMAATFIPKNGSTALVVKQDVAYGLGRMFQILVEKAGLEIKIFRARDEALQWLNAQMKIN